MIYCKKKTPSLKWPEQLVLKCAWNTQPLVVKLLRTKATLRQLRKLFDGNWWPPLSLESPSSFIESIWYPIEWPFADSLWSKDSHYCQWLFLTVTCCGQKGKWLKHFKLIWFFFLLYWHDLLLPASCYRELKALQITHTLPSKSLSVKEYCQNLVPICHICSLVFLNHLLRGQI